MILCAERVSDGQGEHEACGEPAVLRHGLYHLCRGCAEKKLDYLTRKIEAVREAVK